MKKLLFPSLLFIWFLIPNKSSAYAINGWAQITHSLAGFSLNCSAAPVLCCVITGQQIAINHWSGWINGTLSTVLPPDLPDNYPIEFTTDQEIPEN
jgi:hypothetical protein